MKKIALLFLIAALLPSILFAGGQRSSGPQTGASQAGGIPSYINLDGYFPVVKPGTNVTMTVSWQPDEGFAVHNDPDRMFYFRFMKEAFNINLDVTPRAPGNEVKYLIFASGNLPDIWIGGQPPNDISPNDIVNFGISEKMIIPITDYINPVLMPNLYNLYQETPEYKNPCIASDGNIYGFAGYRSKDWLHGPITGGFARIFYNQKYLDQLSVKAPGTLNEYLDLLRRFKAMGPDVLPDAGIYKATNTFPLIYSSLGFHWTNERIITNVGTRNGKATFLYGDREIYPKFVETFKTFYDEGLITRDFFTMEANTRLAITRGGKCGVLPQNPWAITNEEFFYDYVSVKPLTSELNSKIFWMGPNYGTPNLFVITSKCRYPEVVCRMMDYLYDAENAVIGGSGYPDTQSEKNYGMHRGWYIENNEMKHHIDNPTLYPTANHWGMSRLKPLNNMPGLLKGPDVAQRLYGLNPPPEAFDDARPDSWLRKGTYENLSLHTVTEFPVIVYWDESSARRIFDLSSVLNDYAEIQFAQFVTGLRPLSEMNNYFAELDRMNFQEYLKYHVDYYEKVKAK